MREIEVPVLVVGAGGSGLSASNFLADLGVESLLVERHPSTSALPKAHYLNQRTMEIYRHHGLADAIYAKSTPRENLGKVIWQTSLGGDGPLDGVRFAEQDVMGGGALAGVYDLKGVTQPANLPQVRLEPLLRAFAERRNPGRVLFDHEYVSLTQGPDGVRAIIRNKQAGEDLAVRCRYLVAADGGKAVGPSLGVQMLGETKLQDMVVVHITADLSKYLHDDTAVMRMIIHPTQIANVSGAQYYGALLALGPDHWDRHSEEWGVCWGYDPDDPERHNETDVIPRIKQFLKVDVPIEVHRVSHWDLESVVADTFQVGRVLIIGDAAHKHTPGGGLGLNSGIQDAHNICWKLALVLKGLAPESLLASYEVERRPVVERNAEWSMFALLQHSILHSAMGLNYAAPAQFNETMFRKLLAQTPDGESRRARMNEIFDTSRVEFAVHDMEMGFTYPRGAVVDDGSPWPRRDPMGHVYAPAARPGCRMPHAWLRLGGERLSTHDLLPVGGFLVLAGSKGAAWCAAAGRLAAERGVTIRAVQIGDQPGQASDPSGAWSEASGLDEEGAVLVRPDGHVGFRSAGSAADPHAVLAVALQRILGDA